MESATVTSITRSAISTEVTVAWKILIAKIAPTTLATAMYQGKLIVLVMLSPSFYHFPLLKNIICLEFKGILLNVLNLYTITTLKMATVMAPSTLLNVPMMVVIVVRLKGSTIAISVMEIAALAMKLDLFIAPVLSIS